MAEAMMRSWRENWPNYLIEAAGLGAFMVAAGVAVTVLEYPQSPVQQAIPDPFMRRMLVGIAMGLTAIGIIYSPWGKRSGAHINPAVTLTFFRLKKIRPWDATFYVLAQFLGGLAGVILVTLLIRTPFELPPVNYVVTIPGEPGVIVAFIAEMLMSLGLMWGILNVSNSDRFPQFTGLLAGVLVATYITLLAPLSGMSINPARSFASAFPAQIWTAFWIYYFAPPLGMLLAAELYLRQPQRPKVLCVKLCPNDDTPCPARQCCCEISEQRHREGVIGRVQGARCKVQGEP